MSARPLPQHKRVCMVRPAKQSFMKQGHDEPKGQRDDQGRGDEGRRQDEIRQDVDRPERSEPRR